MPDLNRSRSPDDGPRWNWVPVRSLGARHRDRIAAHLIGLDERDRYLRFGYAATDAQILRYVETLDFDNDEIFGIFNRKLVLIAMAHLAFPLAGPSGARPTLAEFGVSVSTSARGRGFGRRLFEHAMLHARNRHVQTLVIHALSENTAMLRIASGLGAKVVRDGSESEARLSLPPDDLVSHLDALVEAQAAEIDYRLKQRGINVERVIDAVTGGRIAH
jgi:ribosomal protein S18 acetylase RimI-like enzyme